MAVPPLVVALPELLLVSPEPSDEALQPGAQQWALRWEVPHRQEPPDGAERLLAWAHLQQAHPLLRRA